MAFELYKKDWYGNREFIGIYADYDEVQNIRQHLIDKAISESNITGIYDNSTYEIKWVW